MSATSRLKRDTAKKKQYLDYSGKMMGQRKTPMTQAQYMGATPAQIAMHQAGTDWEKDKPSARLQRSKKGK